MASPAISVVVPTRDRSERLGRLLESLARQTLGRDIFEVVVVDDASRDGTREMLERLRDGSQATVSLQVVGQHRSRGPASARNLGWRQARGELVAFTDDDCEADARWLERGLAAAREQPGSVVQGRVDPIPRELDGRGAFSRTIAVRGAGPFYETCNIFYPRALLERLGGFDESFPNPGGEDTDLGWRALEAGVTVRFAEDARVYHAVEDLGPLGLLRVATRWSDSMQVLRRHPGLRASMLQGGVFWKRSHALLLLAILGVALARSARPALLLGLPYGRHLVQRCRRAGASPALAPYFAVHDAVELCATVRGGLKHRVLVI